MNPVFATTERQAPLVESHLILHVEAGLVDLLVVIQIGRRTIRPDDRLPMNRVVDVGLQTITIDRKKVAVVTLVIQPQ